MWRFLFEVMEITGKRSLEFSAWIRENCDSTQSGFTATDLDFFIRNFKSKKYVLLETKTNNALLRFGQFMALKDLDAIHKNSTFEGLKYCGLYYLIFERTNPDDGRTYLIPFQHIVDLRPTKDTRIRLNIPQFEITKEQLKHFLSLK